MEHPRHSLQERIAEIRRLLERFRIERHLFEQSAHGKPALERNLIERQQDAELERHLARFHVADLAELLEALPADERQEVWSGIPARRRGEVLLELSEAVMTGLIAGMSHPELVEALRELDADDLAFLGSTVPDAAFQEVVNALNSEERIWVRHAVSYSADSVGHLMASEPLIVHPWQTLASVQARLRGHGELPHNTDKLFVADVRGHLSGTLFLQDILLGDPDASVAQAMKASVVAFHPEEDINDAARAFQRYDLISAPVVNERGKIIGRLTVDTVMDHLRESADINALNVVGIVEKEDLFANVWSSARNRWLWLGINLTAAFFISRIIGSFEDTISKLVALASLMPIIANVAGNSGNQTAALVIRSLALDQLGRGNLRHLFVKELGISLLNGAVWGCVVGLFAYVFYAEFPLSLVVSAAMMLSFVLAALIGVTAPVILDRIGRDPAMGSSVILTGLIDALGFLVFLLLATIFLV